MALRRPEGFELACDEKAVRELDPEGRKAYAEALLACSAPCFALTACPLAFGETDVKKRIRTVVTYRKPAFWVVLASVAVCAVVALCFLTNPNPDKPEKRQFCGPPRFSEGNTDCRASDAKLVL